jgi:hypothetical protein
MKHAPLLLLLLLGCAKKDTPSPTSMLTPDEQRLVGKWNLVSIMNSTKYTNGAPTANYTNNFQGSKNYLQFNADGTWHELIGFDYDGTFTYKPPLLTYTAGRPYLVSQFTAKDLIISRTDSVVQPGFTTYYTIQVRTYSK